MSAVTGFQRALDTYIIENGQGLMDQVIRKRPTLAMLLGAGRDMEKATGLNPIFVRSDSLTGNEARFDFRTGIPIGSGVRAASGNIADLVGVYQERTTTVTLSAEPSYYENSEAIRITEKHRFTSEANPNIAPWTAIKATALMDGLWEAVNRDLWPATNASPSNPLGSSTGAPTEDKVMSFAHPLQTGGASNAANSTTTYSYFGYDLGTNPDSQAVNLGTNSSSAIPDFQTLRRSLMLELDARGADIRNMIAPCDATMFSFIADLIEDKIVVGNSSEGAFGIMGFKLFDGVQFYHEPRLTVLGATANQKREYYFLDPSTWAFNYVWPETGQSGVNGESMISVKEVSSTSTFMNMTSLLMCRLVCLSPRLNGRVYNAATA